MKLCSLASGSSGNSIFVSEGNTKLLLDAGISKSRIENGLDQLGISPLDLQGILITHDHNDHIKGLGVMSRKYSLPIYGTRETLCSIRNCASLGNVDSGLFIEIKADQSFCVNDLNIIPIKTSHDASGSVAYRFESMLEDKAIAVITDLGTYDDYISDHLMGLDAIMIEANHDIKMLEVGRYPYPLKQRILSDHGHLSNELSGRLLTRIMSPRMKEIMLGHLSAENNYPQLALETIKYEFYLSQTDFPESHIYIAGPDAISELIEV